MNKYKIDKSKQKSDSEITIGVLNGPDTNFRRNHGHGMDVSRLCSSHDVAPLENGTDAVVTLFSDFRLVVI